VFYGGSRTRFSDIHDGTSNTLMVGERPPSKDFVFGWLFCGWGMLGGDGAGDGVLGVRERNASGHTLVVDCPKGPYNFKVGNIRENCVVFHFWSLHPGGAHFLFCDGSVRFITYDADPILPALATRSGQDTATLPE
jgi:prepilin-type processing-associated H-X9-DG protein